MSEAAYVVPELLWDEVRASLHPAEIEEVRRALGSAAIARAEALKEELHALADILATFQADNNDKQLRREHEHKKQEAAIGGDKKKKRAQKRASLPPSFAQQLLVQQISTFVAAIRARREHALSGGQGDGGQGRSSGVCDVVGAALDTRRERQVVEHALRSPVAPQRARGDALGRSSGGGGESGSDGGFIDDDDGSGADDDGYFEESKRGGMGGGSRGGRFGGRGLAPARSHRGEVMLRPGSAMGSRAAQRCTRSAGTAAGLVTPRGGLDGAGFGAPSCREHREHRPPSAAHSTVSAPDLGQGSSACPEGIASLADVERMAVPLREALEQEHARLLADAEFLQQCLEEESVVSNDVREERDAAGGGGERGGVGHGVEHRWGQEGEAGEGKEDDDEEDDEDPEPPTMEELRRCSAKLERQLAEEQAQEDLRARMPDVDRPRAPLAEAGQDSLFRSVGGMGGGKGGGAGQSEMPASAPAGGLRAVEPPARRARGGRMRTPCAG